ncbi:hypothetical protein AA042_00015 [Pseudomonas lundensis]|uniref:hypothetical protein n=1 Tax=Pseudomonas lundensis TaxID=86185 RepID=UPI00064238A7|nr:hypothetical protein [Pseudomonas lundensis]AOZ11227.1 hypothetical protein AA042_00015 [Pseudomonas lundensis]QVQ77726.1 hypothetical protein KIN24_01005 [Pseudomonas lundensis]QVQ83206.1 hypothetical protein KIY13_08440 [Pseudomonas lundensis]
MTIKPKPTDAEIKAQIMYWGSQQMTYVIRNGLSMAGRKGLKTNWVRRQLERLERAGQVKRVPSVYARQICWALVEVVRP